MRVNDFEGLLGLVEAKCSRQQLKPSKEKLDEFLLLEAERHSLNIETVKKLANYLKIPFSNPPPSHIRWEPSICKNLKAVKYSNPKNHRDYIVMVPNKLGVSYLSRDPEVGFKEIKWFADFIPQIDLVGMHSNLLNAVKKNGPPPYDFSAQPNRAVFSKIINENINKEYPVLDPVTIRTIHALFDFYVPEVDGVCSKCFQASFAKMGQGISYSKILTPHDHFEISLSPPKSDGHDGQQRMYIRNILRVHGQKVVVKWEPWTKTGPIFTRSMDDQAAHMPYRSHDQSKINEWLAKECRVEDIKKFIGTKSEVILGICQCV